MYSNAIQKLWVVKWETVSGCCTHLTGSFSSFFFFFGFQRVRFRHPRIGLSFVSVCLFMKSHTVRAGRGFNRGGVVLSANGRGLDIGSHSDMFM